MANEITFNNTVAATLLGVNRIPSRSSNKFLSMTGSATCLLSQTIGITNWEALTWGEVTAPAMLWVNNLDDTNTVQLAVADDDSGVFAEIPPGIAQPIVPVAGVTYYAKADTANVEVEKAAA